MRASHSMSRTLFAAALLLPWGLAFTISCRLASRPATASARDEGSVTAALLGSGRVAMSGRFYETADLYFHRGVEHRRATAFSNGWLRRLALRISPERHLHVEGSDIREMMPWLWMAMRMDPHNVEVYLVSAFWLAGAARRPDLAEQVLQEGGAANPFNYPIQLERGRLLMRQHRYAEAEQSLNAALAFWPGASSADSPEARQDRATALLYLATLHEMQDRRLEAAAQFDEIVRLFPERDHLRQRAEALRQGTAPSVLASELLHATLEHESEMRAACDEDEESPHHAADHAH